jgi:hypothetical protein
MERLAVPGAAATLLVYILREIHAGGRPARDFVENIVEHVRAVMAESVASGLVRPSRDEEARLRYLTYQSMGALLMQFLTTPDQAPDAFVEALHASMRETVLPSLELYTEGFLASRESLDDYLRYLWEPPDDQAQAESRR